MDGLRKLNRLAEKLLDTGKRNHLINFKDTKLSSGEVVFPDTESVFSKCSVGHAFTIYDPKLEVVEDIDYPEAVQTTNIIGKQAYIERYSKYIADKDLLIYARTANPMKAVKNIAKKAKETLDETGLNVAYLAFGFVHWNEKEASNVFYNAPLLLVHVSIEVGSVLEPIRIEVNDDDVIVNPTFSYFLNEEYGFTLPEYHDGDSLNTYLESVASTVKPLGWSVINECKLGLFSFLKINMYEDLKNNGALILGNENIKAILGEASEIDTSFSGIDNVVKNPLIDLHTVVDADSSQIEAIKMAKSGKSFVLQGPPGTGKSQTITNIIAECLYDGKKVLFVSEKQAALNVVFEKLRRAGLADFCLELHSHKANKKAVIEELNRTLEAPKSQVSSAVQYEIEQKETAQKRLDGYALELHKTRAGLNKSLYQLYELYSSVRDYPSIKYSIPDIHSKGETYFRKAVGLLEQYADYVQSIGQNYKENSWYGFTKKELSFDERNQLRSDLEQMISSYEALDRLSQSAQNKYQTKMLNLVSLGILQRLLNYIAETDVVTPSLLKAESFEYAIPFIVRMKNLSPDIVSEKQKISQVFKDTIIDSVSAEEIKTQLDQYSSFFSRLFSSEYRALRTKLEQYNARPGNKLRYSDAVTGIVNLAELQDKLQKYKEAENSVPDCLGRCYRGPETDWQHVMESLDQLSEFYKMGVKSFGAISKMNYETFIESQQGFLDDSTHLLNELEIVSEHRSMIDQCFSPDVLNLSKNDFAACLHKLKNSFSAFDILPNWIEFSKLLGDLKKAKLMPFIDQIINDKIQSSDIVEVYKKNYYNQWIQYILFTVPELGSFSRTKQDQAVKYFAEKDRLQYEISKRQIVSELSQKRPDLKLVAGGSAVALLKKEGQKKRKQMPIRRLLATIGDLVQVIKPCFLMSPLSVSTFLDPKAISFDTVIFDEASQIFPQDAFGSIYRGKQIIVVGDSQQMPPSNFFIATIGDEDDDDDIEDVTDFESILDICSAVFATERLAWHYRSHYEQLIAFSNANFYNNHLVTFPSAVIDHKGIGIDYYHVDGVFDRTSKTNRAEAEYIVDLVYENIRQHPERSLGVVAFSQSQQNLIDTLISKRRELDQSQEWFFSGDKEEPFFVKNLETVQGDERDTIIFSVAYAKDANGRFIHNFGPLNREGGERRLNVAVTRAKDNVQLVASIHHTDINLNNTESKGAQLLRAYLDYAENGEIALERAISLAGEDHYDSYFEQEVCEFLRDKGYSVDTQVGCSGYKIDMCVRLPDSSDYVLAIECDGATYHSSKNARDRDALRQAVLENMGWSFYRIWSTDWYKNKATEKDRLLVAVKEAISRKKNKTDSSKNAKQGGVNATVSDTEKMVERRFVREIKATPSFEKYKQYDAMAILRKNENMLSRTIIELIRKEGPLSDELLLKRVVRFYKREKVTKVVLEKHDNMIDYFVTYGIVRRNGFLYLKGQNDIKLRIPGDVREIKHISPEELAAGFKVLVAQNINVTKEGLYQSMTKLLGFGHTTKAIALRYDEALRILLRNKEIIETDGIISIPG